MISIPKLVEAELNLYNLTDKGEEVLIQINKCSNLFVRNRGKNYKDNKVIIILDSMRVEEFETIREMVNWMIELIDAGNHTVEMFAENLILKVEEQTLLNA